MAYRNEKIVETVKNVNFTIIRAVFEAPTGDFFIYTIQPSQKDLLSLKSHPKFHSFSVFATTSWPAGTELNADLDYVYNSRKGEYHYEIKRIIYSWPDNANSQWSPLSRFADAGNYKKVYRQITEAYNHNAKILDILTDETEMSVTVISNKYEKSLPAKTKVNDEKLQKFNDRLILLISSLQDYKGNANFITYIPSEVAEELTDKQIEKLRKMDEQNPKAAAEKFLEQPFSAMSVDGFGFKSLDKIREVLAGLYPDNFNYSNESPARLDAASEYLVDDLTLKNGSTYIDEKEYKTEISKLTNVSQETLAKYLKNNVYQNPKSHIVIADSRVTTQNLLNAEETIYTFFSSTNERAPFSDNYDAQVDKFLEGMSATLTDEQRSVFDSINTNQVTMLVGPGGVGKTWTVGSLIKFVKSDLKKKVLLTAPTGKAAQVLSQYTGHDAHTIHSAFGIGQQVSPIDSKSYDLIVIDEFSMVYSTMMKEIVDYLQRFPKTRLLLVGDEFQLPSVGPGNVLHDLIANNALPIVRLTKVFRAEDENGGIIRLSNQLREGNVTLKNSDKMYAVGNDLAVQHITDSEKLLSRTLGVYKHLLDQGVDPFDIMVITPMNGRLTGQVSLNNYLQYIIMGDKIETEFSLKRKISGFEVRFMMDDLIMFLTNREYGVGVQPGVPTFDGISPITKNVYNGDIGRIIDINEKGLVVQVVGLEEPIVIESDDIGDISLAYASTIHKAQGSQASYGIMVVDSASVFMLNANLLYTGVSRVKKRLYLVGDLNKVRSRSHTFINKTRQTILDKLFKESTI